MYMVLVLNWISPIFLFSCKKLEKNNNLMKFFKLIKHFYSISHLLSFILMIQSFSPPYSMLETLLFTSQSDALDSVQRENQRQKNPKWIFFGCEKPRINYSALMKNANFSRRHDYFYFSGRFRCLDGLDANFFSLGVISSGFFFCENVSVIGSPVCPLDKRTEEMIQAQVCLFEHRLNDVGKYVSLHVGRTIWLGWAQNGRPATMLPINLSQEEEFPCDTVSEIDCRFRFVGGLVSMHDDEFNGRCHG